MFFLIFKKFLDKKTWPESKLYRKQGRKIGLNEKGITALSGHGARSVKTIEPETRVILTFTCWPGFAFAT